MALKKNTRPAKKIPEPTIARLPVYLRCFAAMEPRGNGDRKSVV